MFRGWFSGGSADSPSNSLQGRELEPRVLSQAALPSGRLATDQALRPGS